jgi:hypothetical protein
MINDIINDLLENGLPEFNANIHEMPDDYKYKSKTIKTKINVLYDCDIVKGGNCIFYLN